jgi:DNA-binding CsgD family transcriptional regulator
VGRIDEAVEIIERTRGSTKAIEPAVLAAATGAVAALRAHATDAIQLARDLEEVAFARGAVDILVTAYRANPDLLAVLLHASPRPSRMSTLVCKVGDEDLAGLVGVPMSKDDDPRSTLSPREREVYELLRQGLRNREIAKLLFIEESTVKVHAHHIYDKLGTRSRTALTVQAALERADQATRATGTDDSAEVPDAS